MAINSLSSSSKGFAGLASGMDTESMVKKLLSGTQTKIDRQKQKKTQLTYKQEMYREVNAKLKTLQTNFFSFSGSNSSNNLLSNSFFNTMSAKTSSSAYKVTATSGAPAGSTSVDRISQLARAASIKSSKASSGGLSGAFNKVALDRFTESMEGELVFNVAGGDAQTIDIGSLAGMGNEQAQQELNRLLAAADIDVKATFQNGSFTFATTGNQSLKVQGKDAGTTLLGTTGQIGSVSGSVTTDLFTDKMLPTIDVTLDGIKKSISFNPADSNGLVTAGSVARNLQEAITKAHGGGVKVEAQGNELKFTTDGTSRQLSFGGLAASLNILGLTPGQSSKINTALAIDKLSFSEELVGSEFKFNINGVDFNVTADRSLNSVISEINSSKANVKVSYNTEQDKFTMTSTVSGTESSVKITQKQGNLMSAMFGEASGSDMSSKTLSAARVTLPGGDAFTSKGGSFKLNINGSTVEFTVPALKGDAEYTPRQLVTAINEQLLKDNTSIAAGVQFNYDAIKGEVQMTAKGGQDVRLVNDSGLLFEMGFTGDEHTMVTEDSKLKDIGVSGEMSIKIGTQEYKLDNNKTIKDLTEELEYAIGRHYRREGETLPSDFKVEFDQSTARFRMFGVDIPMSFEVSGDDGALFGASKVEFNKTSTTPAEKTAGQNAKLMVNGTEIERNSNSFTLNGLQFELTSTTQQLDANGDPLFKTDSAGAPVLDSDGNKIALFEKSSKIDVTRDTEKIFEGIVKFVDAYNETIKAINKLTNADATYKDYDPLTTEQKADLSDKEVELWEKNAKEGLLRGDATLTGITNGLRSQLYVRSASSPLGLSDIGITTTPYLSSEKDSVGLLIINADKLKSMINENPEDISKLFTADDDGLAVRINKQLEAATKTEGSLVKLAGAGSSDTTSSIYKQIKAINTNLSDLEVRYEKEYNRYWKQFNSMEQMIQSMNQQSSWLSQQFAS